MVLSSGSKTKWVKLISWCFLVKATELLQRVINHLGNLVQHSLSIAYQPLKPFLQININSCVSCTHIEKALPTDGFVFVFAPGNAYKVFKNDKLFLFPVVIALYQ